MLYTGFRAVIGSWKITAMSLPRTRRSRELFMPISSCPSSLALPVARPLAGSNPSSDIDDWLLPDPDSPTTASTSPGRTS